LIVVEPVKRLFREDCVDGIIRERDLSRMPGTRLRLRAKCDQEAPHPLGWLDSDEAVEAVGK